MCIVTLNDRIRGSLIGGAAGDALGYAVEFMFEKDIAEKYGPDGITDYDRDPDGIALISDDTQMTLFTAEGIMAFATIPGGRPRDFVATAYLNWLITQNYRYDEYKELFDAGRIRPNGISDLLDVKELFSSRAPGTTCLSALESLSDDCEREEGLEIDDFIENRINLSKGCGGIMRVAPIALKLKPGRNFGGGMDRLDYEGAQLAAITHGHSLGYMPAAVLTHVISRLICGNGKTPLEDIIIEARDTVAEIFEDNRNTKYMCDGIDLAMELAKNDASDVDNIHKLGEGWVAEETLDIALYCALKYRNDFSKGIIAAVNHNGDSDSTGAIAGQLIGAMVGYDAIEDKWKKDLELSDVILKMADKLSEDQ